MLTVLVVWFARRPAKTSVPATASSPPVETIATTPAMPVTNVTDSITGHVTVPTLSNALSAPRKSKEQETLEILSTKNDIPIVFYGKLEDQFGNPVVGAEITGSTIIYNGVHMGGQKVVVTSDANGFFQMDAGKGESLGIMPKKAGYTLATANTEFKYTKLNPHPYVPDAGNPTVIKMWKLQGGEHLIHFQFESRVPLDGTPTTFDLQTGQRVQNGGDLTISVKTTPTPSIREEYDWQVVVQAVNGGFVLPTDDFDQMFQAPDSGYNARLDINFQKGTRQWTPRFIGSYYFTSRNQSSYGKLGIEFLSDVVKDGTIPVILNSYVNPSGSRNLEIDPSKMTEAHP